MCEIHRAYVFVLGQNLKKVSKCRAVMFQNVKPVFCLAETITVNDNDSDIFGGDPL